MKKELIKIAFVSIAGYMAICGFFSTVGMIFSVGSSPKVQTVEKEKYVFKAPVFRAIENGDELKLNTSEHENDRVVMLFASNN